MASGFKMTPVSGVKVVTAAGTAERLVSASSDATRLAVVTLLCPGDQGIIIGDSGVDWTAGSTQEGLIVGDGTLASGVFSSVSIDLLSADVGLKGVHGMPFIDLYDLWVDAETSSDRVLWFGLRAV